MNIREIGWDGMYRIDLAQDRDQWRTVADTVMNLRVSQYIQKLLSYYTTDGSSRRAQLHGVLRSVQCKKDMITF
jgi:hypothetical protein